MKASALQRPIPAFDDRFLDCAARLDALIGLDHRQHVDEITATMSEFADDNIAIRYFLKLASDVPDMRTLSGAQSFRVYKGEHYFIRMNLWFPENPMIGSAAMLFREYLSVDVCHNHTFDFFTMGLFGPGYTSTYIETEDSLRDREVGDRFECSRRWDMTLTRGEAVFVQRYRQFHSQHFPPGLSVSLNIIPDRTSGRLSAEDRRARQYVIDPDTCVITRVVLPNDHDT